MVREFKVGTDGEINGDKWTVFELNGELGQLGGPIVSVGFDFWCGRLLVRFSRLLP